MRCKECDIIPLTEFGDPEDYLMSVETFLMMTKAGVLDIVYQNHPLELVYTGFVDDKVKFFHQFRCRKCGTIYGMLANLNTGGEIRINDKVFDPSVGGEVPGGEKK